MKRILCAVTTMAILAGASCSKEANQRYNNLENNDSQVVLNYPSIGASAEENTKASLDNSLRVVWKSGDKIGVRVYKGESYIGYDSGSGYEAKDIDWNLSAGEETTSGTFTSSEALDEWHHWSYAAFFPANNGMGNNGNNVGGGGNVYIHYQTTYNDYVPGSTLMPMVANLSAEGLNKRPDKISLKHVGGAVIITLNNVPAGANKISLTANQNITGWGLINPANAGSSSIASSSLTDAGQTVTLCFAEGAAERDGLVFNFPVPTLTAPTFTINLYRDNTLLWTKSTPSAQPNVTRKGCLEMPELNVDPYYLYVYDEINSSMSSWGSSRTLNIGSDNYNKSGTKLFGTAEYDVFVLPLSVVGESISAYYKGENSCEVKIGSISVASGTHSYFYKTNGFEIETVADATSPGTMPAYSKTIWACVSGDKSEMKIYAYSDNLGIENWGDSQDMTKVEAKYENRTWFYYNHESDAKGTNLIFRLKDGESFNQQTKDITGVSLNSNGTAYCWVNHDDWHDGKMNAGNFGWTF